MIPGGFAILVLVFVLGGLGGVLLIALMRMSHRQDHQARRQEKALDPFSEVTVTR
jgi:hypothetical protein